MSTLISHNTTEWLMKGDPAIRWQVMRDLLDEPAERWQAERNRIALEGWGRRLLDLQDENGLWANGIYSPKWTSTTYTLLLLWRFGLDQDNPKAKYGCQQLIDANCSEDGGIQFSKTWGHSETCISGMVLALASYFRLEDQHTIRNLLQYLLGQQLDDGGWNCQSYDGDTHSSFHSTIIVLEGLLECIRSAGAHNGDAQRSCQRGREFFLRHRLYRSHRTGEIVKPVFTRFSFPPRWHHDVLRTLDHFQSSEAPFDSRLEDPIAVVRQKQRKDRRFPLQNNHPGRVHFQMEKPGKPSRWNTLRALRVLKWWEQIIPAEREPAE